MQIEQTTPPHWEQPLEKKHLLDIIEKSIKNTYSGFFVKYDFSKKYFLKIISNFPAIGLKIILAGYLEKFAFL